ncbi:hypothetical protein ACEPPN_013184 [Leptodophora sp. 'Broadleaf-Isolate-01']
MVLWNPSLTATCGNWQVQSYCVEANGGPTTPVPTTSTSSSTSTTKSAAPTSTVKPLWTLLGCWLDAAQPTLEFRTNITGGDSVMTVEKCQTACYQTGLLIAGLEATSQCWCSSYIANEATNSTECNLPCAGNSAQICGGQNRLSLYKGKLPVTITSRTTTSTSTTSTSSSVPVATAPVSRDGLCGPSSPKKATCASSAFGNCCSSSGKCGWTSEFCSAGICLTDFGTCSTAQAISTDGKCGSASSTKATCRGSAFGQCCSAKGNCGSGVFFCGKSNQCQPLYGNCIDISTDGKCGVASSTGNATCSGSTFGDCCSVKGNCGDTSFFCASYNNCQPQFGTCFPTSTDGKCGAASPSNATCSSSTSFGGCCSVKGNCGNSDAFCNVKNLCRKTMESPKFPTSECLRLVSGLSQSPSGLSLPLPETSSRNILKEAYTDSPMSRTEVRRLYASVDGREMRIGFFCGRNVWNELFW